MKSNLSFTLAAALAMVVSVAYAPVWLIFVVAAMLASAAGFLRLDTAAAATASSTDRLVAESSGLRVSPNGAVEAISDDVRALLGVAADAAVTLDDLTGTDDASRVVDAVDTVCRHAGVVATMSLPVRGLDGWIDAELTLVGRDGGTTAHMTITDVSRYRRLQAASAVRATQLEGLSTLVAQSLAGADEATLVTNAISSLRDGLVVDTVEIHRALDGSPELVAGVGPAGIAVDRDQTPGAGVLQTALDSGEVTTDAAEDASTEIAVPTEDSVVLIRTLTPRRYDDHDLDFIRAVAGTMTLARRRRGAEQDAFHRARHDELTGLVNREVFLERLGTWVRRSGTPGEAVAVLLLDLDHFKIINDSLGHTAGDALLEAVSDRLTTGLRPGDTLARFGGDEFVILSRGLGTVDQAALAGRRMQAALGDPFEIAGHDVQVTASVGAAYCDDPGAVPEELLQRADVALYQAKAEGRERVLLFEPEMLEEAVTRLRTETELREALADDQLRLFYQPVVDLGTGKTVGVEALVRWVHPGRGLVTPAEFIPISEATGLIEEVGAWVINETCRQVRVWTDEGRPMPVSINISPRQLRDASLLQTIDDAVRRHEVDPTLLTVELTENMLVADPAAALATLHELRARGISIAIDDFGTGYSSLSYLKTLPVDTVKIDRSFVAGIDRSGDDYAIISAMVRLVQVLDKQVVAEGVETEQQLELLKDLGCDMAQGFLFSPAVFELEHGASDQSWSRLVLESRR